MHMHMHMLHMCHVRCTCLGDSPLPRNLVIVTEVVPLCHRGRTSQAFKGSKKADGPCRGITEAIKLVASVRASRLVLQREDGNVARRACWFEQRHGSAAADAALVQKEELVAEHHRLEQRREQGAHRGDDREPPERRRKVAVELLFRKPTELGRAQPCRRQPHARKRRRRERRERVEGVAAGGVARPSPGAVSAGREAHTWRDQIAEMAAHEHSEQAGVQLFNQSARRPAWVRVRVRVRERVRVQILRRVLTGGGVRKPRGR